jgi:hypothetical protein
MFSQITSNKHNTDGRWGKEKVIHNNLHHNQGNYGSSVTATYFGKALIQNPRSTEANERAN